MACFKFYNFISNIDVWVKSNIMFQLVCFVYEFQTVFRVLYKYGIIIFITISSLLLSHLHCYFEIVRF